MSKTISCYIVTETSLGIQCSEMLLQEGHKLLGIISNNNEVRNWTIQHGIPYIASLDDFSCLNTYKTFDYLFSIVNGQILKKEILNLPLYYAINYHDAPLPKYAGVHATTWAILNNESSHGISWHIMNEVIDGGNILKQVTFPMSANETTLSLNLKCYAHALDTFKILLQDLTINPFLGKKQNYKDRSYFPRSQTPPQMGFVSWTNSAQDIDRLYRALDFGNYPNTLTTFKTLINKNIFIPTKLDILPYSSRKIPGTITSITNHLVSIATTTQDIGLACFKDEVGNYCSIDTIIRLTKINVGDTLQIPDTKILNNLHSLSNNIINHERFWLKQLKNFSPTQLPFISSLSKQKTKEDSNNQGITISDNFVELSPYQINGRTFSFIDYFITVFLIYLNRMGNTTHFTVGFINSFLKNIPNDLAPFLPNCVPMTFSFTSYTTVYDILCYVKDRIESIQKNKAYFKDIHIRYPELSQSISLPSIIIDITSTTSQKMGLGFYSSSLLITLDENNKTYSFQIQNPQNSVSKVLLKNLPKHIRILFKNIIQSPNSNLEQLPLLTKQEQNQIFLKWNNTKTTYPINKSIHELFEEQVMRTPDKIATIHERQEITYQELNEKSNQLAHYLKKLGVTPDTLIAISVERSLDMIIGLLGILKAEGVYVPIDITYPKERRKFILEDIGNPILIVQSTFKSTFKDYQGIIVVLDHDIDILQESTKTNLNSLTLPDHLAYVIYTSGSTGKPKGIGNTHRGLLNRLLWTLDNYAISEQDRLLHIASLSFDISIWEIIFPLLAGASLVIASEMEKMNILSLTNLIQIYNISIIHFVPSLLNAYATSEEFQKCQSIAQIITGGETLTNELRKKVISKFKNSSLFLAYGPSETSISVTHWNCHTKRNLTKTHIGAPISNTQIYILDSYLNHLPIGAPGEIYISGVSLARGYLNRPDLTADRFIPNPFISEEEAQQGINLRLYRTGDLARYLPDGNIEFIGRIDNQIKIRGFRVELDEIESIISNHSDVVQVTVIARDNISNNKELIAYIVPHKTLFPSVASSSINSLYVLDGESMSTLTDDLKKRLSNFLPNYMVPSLFIYLNRMPLTTNDKIDRKSLPTPVMATRKHTDEYVAPQSHIEHTICEIWTELLKIESIGIHDNFFRIGGDSIISIQIIAKARQKKIYFKVKDIFNHPTIASLSTVVQIQENVSALIPNQGLMTDELLLTPIQHWFFDHNFPDKHHYNQATLLQAQETIVFPILVKTVSYLINHHDALRLRYKKTKKHTWIQECYEKEENIIYKTVDLSLSSDTNLPYDIEKECSIIQQSLNIEKGPIIRVCLFDCGINRPQRLLIVIHHLAVDGVSWRILLEDLEKVYINLFKEENPSLPPKTHSYQQWAKSLMEYSLSSELNEQIPYWTKVFSFIKPLPIDFDKRLTINSITKTISVSLLKEETTDLLQRVPKAYRTQINDILLTALVLTVGDWTGNYELSLSLEGHGREDIIKDIDLSRTVGWFTSIFPVYLHIENHRDLGEAIKTVKETLRQIPNKGIGYGILTYLNRNSTLNNTPYPNLSFNYLGQWDNILNQQDRLFAFTQESPGESTSKNNTESFLIDINGSVQNGILQLFWSYSTNHYQHSTIERLANSFIDKLKQLIQHCCKTENFGYTLSDFPLVSLNQKDLDLIFNNIQYIENIYPLAPMQSGLLFQSLYAPESDAYFLQGIFELEGEISASTMKSAWQKVSNFHPILRTGFIWESLETPMQYVVESTEVPFAIENWEHISLKKQQNKLDQFIKADRKRGFDLKKAPLFRVTLIKYAKNKYYLIWSQHHIITDGWCWPIIFGDVLKSYEDISLGKEPSLKARRPYRDYIAWLQQQKLDTAETFWKNYLASINEPTRLSFSNIIDENKSKDYDMCSVSLSIEETEEIKSFAKQHNLTLNTVIQGAVGIVLRTYTQKNEIVMGVTVSGRDIELPGIEEMVGLFINTLPLKMSFDPEVNILFFLKSLQNDTQQLNNHSFTPLAQIQSWSNINQSLFDVLFIFENYPIDEKYSNITSSFTIKRTKWIEKTEYPFTIEVRPGKQLHFLFGYQLGKVNERLLKKLIHYIRTILRLFILNCEKSLQAFSILTAKERQQLLIEWNNTKAPYPSNKCIHELFEEQVDKTPDSIAVVYEDQELSYQQLNERANQLAHYLRSLGVDPDTLVAIAVERSLEMIIGLLGILKAGGAYVPLDPSYPQERIKFMLEDTNVSIMITDINTIDKLPSTWARVICLDDEWSQIKTLSSSPLEQITMSHNLAYVIYTSGSTGIPKGVMITHKNIVTSIWTRSSYYSSTDLQIPIFSSIGFDITTALIFWSLTQGGILLLPKENINHYPLEVIDMIKNKNITHVTFVPSVYNLLFQYKTFSNLPCLKLVFLGGEECPKELPLKHLQYLPTVDLFNEYGPTETTVCSSVGCIYDSLSQEKAKYITIGKQRANTQIYILDTYLSPIPIGVTGEIYIGGAGLARGYLNRPDLTADRFIPNPFISDEDAQQGINLRLYRTGDLARYLPDGNIEFIGRIDDQVKIRGFRIELGEIESTLADHGDIANAIVTVREDEPDNKRLVAYIVPKQNKFLSLTTESTFTSSSDDKISVLSGDGLITLTETLRNHLAQSLPDYMVPSFFVFIDKVPLSPNGKIDRKSLPAPDLSFRNLEDEYVAPSTPLEQELASIWTEVLKIESIGIHDNFFKIGGHSLLATQVISRIRHNYNIDIPLRSLFDHPSIASLSLVVDSLVTGKVNSSLPAIVPMERGSSIPLSFAQQRLWFLDQLLPDSALYNIPIALRLKGSLNLIALEDALNALMQRHESLRTIFPSSQGEASQVILPTYRLDIKDNIIDLANLPSEEQESSLQDIALKEANSPFNLSIGPLVRIKLISLAGKEYALLMTMHHIVSDGWSGSIFFRELSALYNAYAEGNDPLLPSLTIQYADFALWQRKWLQGEVLEQQLSYWKEQLADIPDLLELPTDKPRPKELSHKGGSYHYVLSKDIRDQLNSLAHKNQASLFMTLLTAFQILLYRYSGQKDIVVGSPIANRHYKEIEGIIGFFVNTLALRTTFKDHETFIDILNQVKETTLQAYQHQDVPFEQLVDYLNISRALNRNPVFQVLFTLEKVREENPLIFNSVDINPLHLADPAAKFDLSFNVHEGNDGIGIEISYETDLFEYSTIERMGLNFKELIQAIIKDPIQPIEELSILTTEERQQLLIEWNDTKAPYPSNKCIHELFEEQVDKTPDSIAVVYEDQELSYQQLNERANQLAHYLRSLGVGPDTLVAIAVERSLEMIIGLLGILKAGGAYVPLDPSYPQERIKFMLEDTQASILITQQSLKDGDYAGTIIALDKDWKIIQHQSRTNLITLTYPHHLAYVIYTSGSTGKPKGVMGMHKNIINRLFWMWKLFPFTKNEAICQKTSLNFIDSVWEIWGALLNETKLIIISLYGSKNSETLVILLKKFIITRLVLVPSLLNSILKLPNLDKSSFLYLKILSVSGESVSPELLNICFKLLSCPQILNLYGSSEITADVTYYKFLLNIKGFSIAPIGQPISNTQIYILDTYLNPIPIGVTGEIYIGGAGLARGYLNRPDLTADRFIPNPFISDEDAQQGINLRLYRTGDVARYLPDGNIEFIGRIDDQVKIRGFRIELGEIESTLADHGDVANAIVTVREDEPDNKRLVAYIIPKQNKFLSLTTESTFTSSSDDKISVLSGDGLITLTETLRNHLAQSLPDYMVPSFFVFIDKVPLSPNGKIDRKSLPAPDLSFRNLEDEYVAPSTPLEQELASIWTEVLKIESIGIHDNFFKIGGHSLLATQVISRIRHNYNIDIPLRSLFDHPSIASLSLVVDSLVTGKVNSSLPAIVPMERGSSIPLSFAQQRLWFLDQLLPDSALYNIPIALRLKGSLNLIALEDALNALMQRHESLRTIFPSSQGEASQVILPTYRLDIKDNIIDLANLPSEEQESSLQDIALKEANSPFNLSIGPLVRIKLISLADKEYALLMTMHHIVSDGWSMGIFFKELSSLYNSYNENNLPSLSPLNIQYADFALWQRKWLQGEVLEQQLSYWKEQLADIPDLLELPTDKPRPKELSHKGGSYHYVLSKDIRDQLNSLAHKNQASLFMTLLTAFQILLYRYSGQKDIVVGSPIANRHYKEIEGIIGFFVNTLALRTTFKDHETFIDILNQVKETTLQAYQHQDVYFDQLVDYLNISRALNRNPVFQVEFSLESLSHNKEIPLNDILIEALHVENSVARFDLRVLINETKDALFSHIDYSTDLFNLLTIEKLAIHFEELLKSIIKDPIQPIEELSILTAKERQQLLIEWNNTKAPYPSNKCIHELFEEQVDKTPDSIAVVYEDQELSYQQLNERANQLAHYLRSLGVGPDTLVAIAVERSLEMIIGLLGILKAGGAYVPLDPSYPQERIKFMLEDTQASILITQQSLKDGFKDYAGTIIALDKDWKIIQHQSRTNLITLTYPHHLAYVIYTSGSTGKPKGVMVGHKGLSNRLIWMQIKYALKPSDRVLQKTPFTFDVSFWEFFLPLLGGSILVIIEPKIHTDPSLLSRLIIRHKISICHFIPLMLQNFMAIQNNSTKYLPKLIITSGESLSYKLTQEFCSIPETQLYNLYGPTEASIDVTSYHCTQNNDYIIPIGRPISNTQIYILDTYLNPIPIGVTGEIYIGGAGLARGYLNRPDLTADRFIPNPFISDGDAQQGINLRLYRTGDLARYLPDGNIEFIGRIDDQVKIRGFRIELGEIESTLADHGDVANAIVTVREDESDNKRLVAYIVPKQNKFLSLTTESTFTSSSDDKISVLSGDGLITLTETLRNHLAQSLPDYMVPSFFVFIDKVPLSPNGKIDRKSLPAPDLSLRNLEDEYVAPSTPLEQELASIWTEVLKIESIGIHDNFFRIGGDSIISIQIIAKARQKKIYFKVKDIFNHPTIASLSTVVQIQENVSALIPNQGLMTGELLLTPIQHWFFDHNFPDKHHYNQATLLQAQETIVFPILVKTVSYLINHHDALRLRYKKTKKHTWIQECYEKEENIICKTVDLSLSSDTNLPYDIEKECSIIQQSLNIEKGPIIRVCLFDCGINRPQRLLIVIHHLAVDGVSWRILLEDLEKVYINLFKEENPSLPPKTHSYQQWAKSLMEYSLSSELNEQIPYWTKVFSFIKPLPIDFDKRLTINSITKTISVSLLKEETTDLLQRVPKAYRTQINDILLTALVLTVGDWTGNYELSLSLEGHGREDIIKDIDLSRTVGWFTSIFPVYLHIENHRDLGEAIKTVKETLRQIPNKGIGYGILTYLNRNSTLNNTPYPNLSFNYLGQWDNILNQQDRLFAFTQESPGESTSKNNTESFLIDINGSVQNGILQLFWSYSTNHYQHSTIERLANSFIDKLKQLIQYCYNNDNYHYTASDFDLSKLDQVKIIDNIIKNIANE